MEFYHIQTLLPPNRASLITTGMFYSDMAAIQAARQYLRRGEGLEVWRSGTLVYRCCPDDRAPVYRAAKTGAAKNDVTSLARRWLRVRRPQAEGDGTPSSAL
jgi:hypothetical protein